jgi:hypothetical protein
MSTQLALDLEQSSTVASSQAAERHPADEVNAWLGSVGMPFEMDDEGNGGDDG